MSEALTLKYRPKRWSDFVGQSKLVKFLSVLIQRGQIGKNLIIHGHFGSGKTSSGRYYAQTLLCEGILDSGDACGTCQACQMFQTKMGHPSVLETDGGSNGGKDKIHQLVEIAKTPPLIGRYRIIIQDEVQGYSKQAWDVLLKLVEEPPPHLVFIFLTTEIDKVREAIKSRCLLLNVELLNLPDSKNYLKKVCDLEQFSYEEEALNALAYLAQGHPRDLLRNLEHVQILGDITLENVRDIFNLGYIRNLVTLFKALFQGDLNSLRNSMKAWLGDPATKLNRVMEFLLHLQSKCLFALDLNVQADFNLIPEGELLDIWNLFVKNLNGSGIKPAKAYTLMVSEFSKFRVSSEISFQTVFFQIYHLIHTMSFNLDASEVAGGSGVSVGKKKRRRKFSKNYKRAAESKKSQVEGVLYPHTLTNFGFAPEEKHKLSICRKE